MRRIGFIISPTDGLIPNRPVQVKRGARQVTLWKWRSFVLGKSPLSTCTPDPTYSIEASI